ncbi:MAG: hypothetical protein ACLQJL_01820 [Roseiarcus sp.]
MRLFINFVAGVILAASTISLSWALEAFPSDDPRFVVQTVIDLTDRHALPGWDDADFAAKLAPYLTRDLLAVVRSGGRIAIKKHINLYDGEFFTGSQGLEHARLFSATLIKQDGDNATVEASIGTSDDRNVQPKAGDRTRFQLKRVGGVWKIDDFRNLEDYAKTQPSVKTLFKDPMRYGN